MKYKSIHIFRFDSSAIESEIDLFKLGFGRRWRRLIRQLWQIRFPDFGYDYVVVADQQNHVLEFRLVKSSCFRRLFSNNNEMVCKSDSNCLNPKDLEETLKQFLTTFVSRNYQRHCQEADRLAQSLAALHQQSDVGVVLYL